MAEAVTTTLVDSVAAPAAEVGLSQPCPWQAAWTLCRREWVRFVRQKNRLIGAIGQPLLFWLLFGAGLGPSFRMGAPPPVAADVGTTTNAVAGSTASGCRRDRRSSGRNHFPAIFLSRHVGADSAVHRDFRHDLGDRRPARRIFAIGAGRPHSPLVDGIGQVGWRHADRRHASSALFAVGLHARFAAWAFGSPGGDRLDVRHRAWA